jgi:hypothetical protein
VLDLSLRISQQYEKLINHLVLGFAADKHAEILFGDFVGIKSLINLAEQLPSDTHDFSSPHFQHR